MSIQIATKWNRNGPAWYKVFEIIIYNNSTEVIVNPTIEFKISYFDRISVIQGFKMISNTKYVNSNTIVGELSENNNEIPPNNFKSFSIGVTFKHHSEGFLPFDFKINGDLITAL
ncbi:hypothetical protein DLAC_01637 [Tieghemostelium lacteum]|uniref:Carbohydrate binding domain-containing protein n=1 Tax=Tieghemostelium lacteum TaxID=361077 RepID=A0A152A697_TIELA|nr:hypothetical protein DLAC_01637 [Tieghemostelium lacteum]|eukprot:KYR01635.1 hypothetical protein DLAC_01637 [Tieghemostelium lacteum]